MISRVTLARAVTAGSLNRCRRAFAIIVVMTAACDRVDTPVAVADGVPRLVDPSSFMNVIDDALDSAGTNSVRRLAWTEPKDEFVGSEVAQAERFARMPSVIAVVGHSGSRNTLIAAPVYVASGVPLIVPTATSAQLRTSGPLVFMMAPTDNVEGAFIVDHALDSLRATRIAMAYVADAYGTGVHSGIVARLAARNSALVGEAAMSGRECARPDRLALRGTTRALILRAKPQVIVLAVHSALAGCMIRQILAVDSSIKIIASDSFDEIQPPVRALSNRERAAVRYVSFWTPGTDSLSQAFVARMRRLLGREPDAGEALTFDAYLLVATAYREGHRTRAALGRWLRALGTSQHPPVMGVTGPIAFQKPREALLHLRAMKDSGQ